MERRIAILLDKRQLPKYTTYSHTDTLCELRNNSSPARNLCSLSMEGGALLRVREILDLEELGFSVLLSESHYDDRIVVEFVASDRSEYSCGLR